MKLLQPARAISVSKDENGQLNGVRISKDGTETECMRSMRNREVLTDTDFNSFLHKTRHYLRRMDSSRLLLTLPEIWNSSSNLFSSRPLATRTEPILQLRRAR